MSRILLSALTIWRPMGGLQTSREGYVYILFNSAMSSLVKIGQTTREPEDRAQEIGGTGVPGRFVVVYRERVPDCIATERRIHRELARFRYDPKREFFQLSLEVAISAVREIAEDDRQHWNAKAAISPSTDEDAAVTTKMLVTGDAAVATEMFASAILAEAATVAAATPIPPSPSVSSFPSSGHSSGLPAAATKQPSWGFVSSLLLLVCVFSVVCAVIAVVVSIEELTKGNGTPLAAGIVASIIIIGLPVLVADLARRGAMKLRSKGW